MEGHQSDSRMRKVTDFCLQSISGSVGQLLNKPINKHRNHKGIKKDKNTQSQQVSKLSFGWWFGLPIGQSFDKSVSQLVHQSVGQLVSKSFSQSVSELVSQSVGQSVNQLVSQSISWSVSQPVGQSVNQSVSHSVNQSSNQLVCQTVSWPVRAFLHEQTKLEFSRQNQRANFVLTCFCIWQALKI